ncbi:hypothetical protein JQX13_38750 [Archangium violaceum]|uniref:hypothetical protein n=1 Tax=Archangium violaceum TaxID=83451 RepID=UPI00193C4ED9|nr:hypothetical protein [Archangium violaceum]QRK06024.1 hypothetical protein JQX13_38750 [Archangium violaceum]
MEKTNKAKLRLNKETLRNLSADTRNKAGDGDSMALLCSVVCDSAVCSVIAVLCSN